MVKKVSTVGPFNECMQTEDVDDNFLEDPALFYDELPQPYRRINKILLEVFNDAWEEIAKWEAARIKDASRIRPPVYDCASQLQVGLIAWTLTRCCSVLSRRFRLKDRYIGTLIVSVAEELCGIFWHAARMPDGTRFSNDDTNLTLTLTDPHDA